VLTPPLLTPHLLALAAWIAEYYLAPLGEVLAAALPGGLEGFAASRARKRAVEEAVLALALPEPHALTDEQRAASRAVEAALARRAFAPLLFHGVTASGKTEVYLRAAHTAREAGGQTLVLVPEVALAAQVVAAFRHRFGPRVGVLHSYLSLGERRRNWELASRGALDVVVGARSAVFAPLPDLRLIVVDEEHEPAYKQSEQLRYHGRDVAVRRAQLLGIPIVLGSATPSLESLANAARGKYQRVRLAARVAGRAHPVMRVIDLRREERGDLLLSHPLRAALAARLERGEQSMLFLNRRGHSHHTQCRACGFVPECPNCDIALTLHLQPRVWRCHYCDHRVPATTACPSCAAPLLRYGGPGTQRAERELAAAFPRARVLRLDLDAVRAGAGRPSPALVGAAPRGAPGGAWSGPGDGPGVPRAAWSGLGDTLRRFARGEADVLLGTQMIAKGLDFPRVTLVGVLDADVALHLPDFRAAERTWQLLVQVAGRAGRGERPGEVLVQTCTPDHPAIAAAVLLDEGAFLDRELAERREAGYPPFVRLATLLFSGPDEGEVERTATQAAAAMRTATGAAGAANGAGGVRVLGPAPQPLARLRNQHRWHVLLKGRQAAALRAVALAGLAAAEALRREGRGRPRGDVARAVRVIVDVDPVEVL
jgi:primosomal protein N' (replication factor Y) (superfamily II helicase)